MHLRAYQENEEIRAVCHAHPPVCTCYAIAGIPLTAPVLAYAVITLGDLPIVPYAKLGITRPGIAWNPWNTMPIFC